MISDGIRENYGFIYSLKRIFEWIPEAKIDFIILICREIFVQIFAILSLILLSQITSIFQNGSIESLTQFLLVYIILAIIHLIVRWYTTPW